MEATIHEANNGGTSNDVPSLSDFDRDDNALDSDLEIVDDLPPPPFKVKKKRKSDGKPRTRKPKALLPYVLHRKIKCRLCDQYLVNLSHMYQEHNMSAACPVCEETNIPDVVHHVNVVHLGLTEYACDVCPFKCWEIKEYEHHKTKHEVIKKFQCRVCGQWFPDLSSRKAHDAEHANGPEPKRYIKKLNPKAQIQSSASCSVCGKAFHGTQYLLAKRLRLHQRHHNPVEKLHKCGTCGKGFALRAQLIRHYTTHSDSRPYHCSFGKCTKTFKTSNHLRQHELFHKEPQHVCDLCGCAFILPQGLRKHKPLCPRKLGDP